MIDPTRFNAVVPEALQHSSKIIDILLDHISTLAYAPRRSRFVSTSCCLAFFGPFGFPWDTSSKQDASYMVDSLRPVE